VRAEVCHKIVFEKDPGAANLCAGYSSGLGALSQLLGMHPEKGSGFAEIECRPAPCTLWR